jgi:hypothetical protein
MNIFHVGLLVLGIYLLGRKPTSSSAFAGKTGAASSCPVATQDLKLNTRNRNRAIDEPWIRYGPLNLSDKAYWVMVAERWNTTPAVAKKSRCRNCVAFDISPRMDTCMPGQVQDKEGRLGYCWMHEFKCHSARSCLTWAAGGPITTDSVSLSWQNKGAK